MTLFSRDTRESAARLQLAAWRAMSGAERYGLGAEMSDYARDIALRALRDRNPGMEEGDLHRLYLVRVLGWRLPSR